jgi:iron complex transport system substrate-binding protein
MLKRFIPLAALLCSSALFSNALFSQAFATTYPLTLKDDLGRTVTIPAEPKRIVALLPSHSEMIYALSAGPKMIGRDDYSDYPPEVLKLPKLGGLYNPNLEAILALKPDLVLNAEYGDLTPKLEKAGVTVWAGSPQTYDDIFVTLTTLGKMLNREDAAASLNKRIQLEVKEVETVTKAIKKTSVYYEIDPTPYSVGPNSFIGVILTKSGGLNIIPNTLGDFPQIAPELVVKQNPSVIIGVSCPDAAKRPGWANIAAVKNNRCYTLTPEQDNLVSRPGPRIAGGLKVLAKLINPDLFR